MPKRAVLGFSYGYRKDGPGLSNRALMRRLYEHFAELGEPQNIDLILQHKLVDAHKKEELAQYEELSGLKIVHVIHEHRVAGRYLDTDEVAFQGIGFAAAQKYEEVYVLAKPIPHLVFCWMLTRKLAKQYGINVKIAWVGFIPNDPLSEQPGTRNAIGPYIYTLKRVFLGRKGI